MVEIFSIDLNERRLFDGDKPAKVRRKTFDLLAFFVRNEGRLLSQRELYDAVWGDRHVSDTLLKGCVRELRKIFRDEARHSRFIEAVPGHGYRFLGGVRLSAQLSHPLAPWTECLPTVAILPVACPSGDADLGHLAHIATEAISAEIKQHSRLCLVDARHMPHHDWKKHRTRTIGRYLSAQALVMGRLERFGPQLRLELQLLHAESGRCLWRASYGAAVRAELAFVGRTSRAAAGQVALHLQSQSWMQVLTAAPTAMRPYDYVLLGEHRPATSAEQNLAARQDYLQAIALDPGCAPGWAGLAHNHAIEGLFAYSQDYEACMDAALAASMQACDRGPHDAKAAWVLGHALSLRGETAAALKAFERAERLAPRDADVLVMKGMALQFAGQPKQAMVAHRRALRLNPDPPGWYLWNAAAAAYQCRAYDQALALLEPFVARRPNFLRPRYSLAATYAQVGRHADAERAIAPVLLSDNAASVGREYARSRMIGIHDQITDHWLEGLARAGLRS